MKIRVATRKSKMAVTQTKQVVRALEAANPGLECELVEMHSDGCYDKFKGNIKDAGGKGVFIKRLELALLNDEADIAVHSLKDVPTDEELPEGLEIAATVEREDRRDVAVCREGESFAGLKPGSRVGTSSIRRAAQIRANFPYLEVVPLRGNADTRIQKLDDGEVDAAILAKAGLERINLQHRIDMVFEPDILCPALTQGILAIECRSEDKDVIDALAKINHEHTFICAMAEREMLKKLQGNCLTPVGGYCEVTQSGENLRLIAMVAAEDGSEMVWTRQKMPYGQHLEIGRTAAEDLLSKGAAQFIKPVEEAS
jgi:hydroxymethylbilane synthase